MLMLVHTRSPREEPPAQRHWTPNWPMWAWLAGAAVAAYAASAAEGALEAALAMVAFVAVCRALTVALPYGGGLSEWRQ
jgi:uncharacterized membrane protein YdcZ (DUF606 family)